MGKIILLVILLLSFNLVSSALQVTYDDDSLPRINPSATGDINQTIINQTNNTFINTFDQSLNTTDDVTFTKVTVDNIPNTNHFIQFGSNLNNKISFDDSSGIFNWNVNELFLGSSSLDMTTTTGLLYSADISSAQVFYPGGDGTYDLGKSTLQWDNFYAVSGIFSGDINATEGFFDSNITVGGSIKQNGYEIKDLPTNSFIDDDLLAFEFNRSGDKLPIVGWQSGGPGQASYVASSFMLVNRNESILNNTNRTDCQAHADLNGIELKIDCNTTGSENPLGTGPDLLGFGDFQMSGEGWLRDTQEEWHFFSRELTLSDEMRDKTLTSQVNNSLIGNNLTIAETNGDNIVVNLDEQTFILNKSIDSILLTTGTNSSPTFNHIYYNGGGGTPVLTKASTDQEDKADVAQILYGSDYVYGSIIGSATGSEFIRGVYRRFYDDGALYKSGFNITAGPTEINISTGQIKVLLSDFDISTTHSTLNTSIEIHSDGTFHQHINNLSGFDEYVTGESISNNRYFNLVCGIAVTSDNAGRLYCIAQDKPATEHTSETNAETDNSYINFFPSNDFIKKIYTPIVRVVMRRQSNVNTIQTLSTGSYFLDLRGTISGGGSSPTPGITSHKNLDDLEWNESLHTFNNANQEMDIGSYNLTTTGNITADYFIGNGSQLTGIESGIWDNDTYVRLKDGNGPNVNISGNLLVQDNISLYNDSTKVYIDDSKFTFENTNIDKEMIFSINQDGVQKDFLTLDPSGQTPQLVLDGSGVTLDTNGLFRIEGDYNVSTVGVGFAFSPTIQQGNNFVGLFANPTIQGGSNVQAFRLAPIISNSDQSMTGFTLIPSPHVADFNDNIVGMTDGNYNRQFLAFASNDSTTSTITGINWGGPVIMGNFNPNVTINVNYTEKMINLIGGGSRSGFAGGKIEQTGIKLSGFGTQSGLLSNDFVHALNADGGEFHFAFDYDGSTNAIFLGAGDDAGLGYDGTDLVLDPDLVGSGKVRIDGDLNVTGNSTSEFMMIGNGAYIGYNSTCSFIFYNSTGSIMSTQGCV
jgi:hypothetical protein